MLPDDLEIRLPADLFRLLLLIRDAIAAGTLREGAGNVRVDQVREGKPWPDDVIRIEFESIPPGSRYELVAETYHGRGGRWRRI